MGEPRPRPEPGARCASRGPRAGRWSALTSSPRETLALGEKIGSVLRGGEVLALSGDLGSGKTTLTRGIAIGLGIADARLVSSPTYVLEQIYPARVTIHHFDTYRLASVEELLAIGFEEHVGDPHCVLIVEWADRVAGVLPPERLLIELSVPSCPPEAMDGGEPPPCFRNIVLSGLEASWSALLDPILPRT